MVMVLELALALAGAASCIAVIATGMQAPIPSPASRRSTPIIATLGTRGSSRVKTENTITQTISGTLRPKRSEIGPIRAAPRPTPTSEIVEM